MSLPSVHRQSRRRPTIHYVEYAGDGPTLLLLHGVTRNCGDWEVMLPMLCERWRVVALDHLGHGKSDRTPGRYRVVDYARAVTEFVRETFTEPLTVMGHSLGAMVALWLAGECAPLASCVVLEDPPFHTMGNRITATPYLALFEGMQSVLRKGGSVDHMTSALAAIRVPTPQGLVSLGTIRERAALQFSAESLMQLDLDVLTPLIAGRWLDDFDYEALWTRVRCPVVLLQGDPNAGGAFADADVAAARVRLANSRHVRFHGIGHQIHNTCPDQVLTELNRFAFS